MHSRPKDRSAATSKAWPATLPWWILLVAGVAVLLFNSIRDGVAVFYFTDYVRSAYKLPHLGWTLGTLYLLLGQLGNMAGVALAVPLAARIGKKALCRSDGCWQAC